MIAPTRRRDGDRSVTRHWQLFAQALGLPRNRNRKLTDVERQVVDCKVSQASTNSPPSAVWNLALMIFPVVVDATEASTP
jgi:hypothetical protein